MRAPELVRKYLIFVGLFTLPVLGSAGCPASDNPSDGGGVAPGDDVSDAGVVPTHGDDAGAKVVDDPPQAGDCSGSEVLSKTGGHLNLLTGESEKLLFCHKLESPPNAVFFTKDVCFRISADGTGTLDTAGGYEESGIQPTGYVRQDSIVDFAWGGLVDGKGGYQVDSTYGGIPVYWQRKDNAKSVDPQTPLLYWDSASGAFTNSYPTIVKGLPTAGVKSAACMFLDPTCITTTSEKTCWANGVLDGEYERHDYMGRLEEKGTYTKGKKSGTWTDFTYGYTDLTPLGRTEKTYRAGDEDGYGYREYSADVLIEEGAYKRSTDAAFVKDGEWKYYHSASETVKAPGILSRVENYALGMSVGKWTTYSILYDTDRPTGTYQVVDAWVATRKAIDVCVHSVTDYETKLTVTTDHGTTLCQAQNGGICNDPIYVIETTQEKADGSHETTCTTGSGEPRNCPSVTCQ
jgi:antitoxin component YwqK of YwqJK toxin-antitoxin module